MDYSKPRTDQTQAPHTQERAARCLWLETILRALKDAQGISMGNASKLHKERMRQDAIDWIQNPHRSGMNAQRVADNASVSVGAVRRVGRYCISQYTPPGERISRDEKVELRLERAMEFAIEYEREHGDFPSNTAVGDALGLSDTAGGDYVERLRNRGYVEGGRTDRSLTEKAFATTH